MKLSQVEWGKVIKAALKEYSKDDLPGLAAEMAYHFIFALFPFVIFLAGLTGIIGRIVGQGQLFNDIMQNLYSALPPDSARALEEPLNQVLAGQAASGVAFVVGLLGALFSASNAVTTVMKAFNRAYGVEETRNFIVKKVVALGLTLAITILLIGGTIFLLLGNKIGDWIFGQLSMSGAFRWVWLAIRIVAAMIGISLALALLYWQGPNVKQQFRWLTPGSIVTTICLLIFTGLFGLAARYFLQGSYSKTYGPIAGIILFLFYLYWANTVILLGAELNAETTKRYDPATIRDKITDPRKQLPGEQPSPDPRAAREAGLSPQQVTATNTSSAGKVASGGGSPATAAAASRAGSDGAAPDVGAQPQGFDDPSVRDRLRALRERPPAAAAAQARRQQSSLTTRERAERARATLAAFAVSALTALGGLVFGAWRRRASH